MSQSLPATHSQHSLQQEQPESSKDLAPPPPLRADTDEFPALDDVLRKKRSSKLFAPLSGRRSRKDSRASSARLSIANERLPPTCVDAEVAESGTQEIEVQQNDCIIQLDTPAPAPSEQEKTVFRWAKLYENQRGITLLGQANYGFRSLLPKIDPTPFTHDLDGQSFNTPEEAEAAMSTPATLRDYQLPDGHWRWVSKTWMVDMDGNGDTCADGWQYNWGFRKKGWRPHPGNLSAGGWVRRRHWLRLMMRPAERDKRHLHPSSSPKFRSDSPLASGSSSPSVGRSRGNSSATGSRAPGSSIIITDPKGTSIISALEPDDDDVSTSAYSALGHTWRGEPASDWERCRRVLAHYNRDGKKLEVWSEWLGITHDAEDAHAPAISEDYLTVKGKDKMEAGDYATVKATPKDSEDYLTVKAKGKEKEKHLPDTEDFVQSPLDIPDPMALSTDEFFTPRPIFAAPKEYVEVVIRDHLEEILNLFVFPSSRTQFRVMLSKAGLLDDEANDAASAMLPTTPSQPEFWTRRPHSPSPSSSEHSQSKPPTPSVSRHTSRKKGKQPASGASEIDQTKPTSRDHTRYASQSEDEPEPTVERTDEPGRKKLSALDGSLHVAATE
ncbi:hypothetical protein M407DRAFT_189057 [Tulasnella calospora MUT 4182]|uniref:TECPR1-like DysF domain-containing protein n=1 Tax=Tulasnella calospora MUT 4182 TaxID=1051891 RepID=A0A0C3QLV3_9AGAM|nr:hypothetical protein M407DRAFT_189057 [Tulasnella calospora MUT 4182]